MIYIDFYLVVIAAISYMLISALWYSKLFFKNRVSKIVKVKKNKKELVIAYLISFIVALFISYFLALFQVYVGATTFTDGLLSGFIVWIGVVLPINLNSFIWKKSKKELFFIENGHYLLSLLVMGAVLIG